MILLVQNMMKLVDKKDPKAPAGYPLEIKAEKMEIIKMDYKRDQILAIIPKLNYEVLYKTAESLKLADNLPQELIENYEKDDDFLRKIQHLLFEVQIIRGEAVCPVTGKKIPITNNMFDEVDMEMA